MCEWAETIAIVSISASILSKGMLHSVVSTQLCMTDIVMFTPNETKYNSDSIFGANFTPKLSLVAVICHNLQNWKIFPCNPVCFTPTFLLIDFLSAFLNFPNVFFLCRLGDYPAGDFLGSSSNE